jgi:type I restriction-modification system DNA methylase subunit
VTKGSVSGAFQQYLQAIKKSVQKGDYTEMTLRTPLENFIKGLSLDYDVTHEAKRLKALGAPDFTAYRSGVNVGYIEAKDLGKNLDEELEGKQLKKYRESIDNIILTDYRRFILIRGKEPIFDQSLFSLADLSKPKSQISVSKIGEFLQLTDTFFGYNQPTIQSAQVLASELAKKTKLLKDLAIEQLEEDLVQVERDLPPSSLYDFYEALNELIRDIRIEDCADAYAQTITYGLFLAKTNSKKALHRDSAAADIPRSIRIIRKIFSNIAGDTLPSNVSWIVDALINILNASEMENILSEIDFRGKKDRDPFTFFYEDFLAFYEPEKKKRLGVYYTPRPVVSFIVNTVNEILKNDFDKPMGFAEDGLKVLDPAVGTGTFLWLVFLLTLGELKEQLRGLIRSKTKSHILKDFYGFELLITPYVIAHLKLTSVLRSWFYELEEDDRVQVYLTNTLDPFESHHVPFFRELDQESKTADELKKATPILVILGNPPYSVSSANKSQWITERMSDYKRGLHEKNIQPLDDDYIKFIRFAQWKIDQNKSGIVGLITNNNYLDGKIYRQMRRCLYDSFDRMYFVNLHGDLRKRESSPDGSKDENVFDITKGVAIAIFVKNDKFEDKKVYCTDVFGDRQHKYYWLDKNSRWLKSGGGRIEWDEVTPAEPDYFFAKKDTALQSSYNSFYPITDIFASYKSGVSTLRDHFVVSFTKSELRAKMDLFQSGESDESIKNALKLRDTRDWSLSKARSGFKNLDYSTYILNYTYRPFDTRFICYAPQLYDRGCARADLMSNFYEPNVGLITRRNCRTRWHDVFVTENVTDMNFLDARTYVFPLYVYKNDLRESSAPFQNHKHPNFTSEFSTFLKGLYPNESITAEEVLGYVYALLHSPTYRDSYEEFLKMDFPRMNFVSSYNMFVNISELGTKLVDLHLMKTRLKAETAFNVQGSNLVKSAKYQEGKVYINDTQFFEPVPEYVWTFYIGGYQVLDKWLKSRKGRELSSSEIEHFRQIVETVKKTIELMKEIDGLTHF